MAETTPKSGPKRPQKSKKTRVAAKSARKSAGASRIFIAIVVIAALAGGGYLWQQRALNARIASGEQRDRINDRVNDIEKRLDAFLASRENLGESVNQLSEQSNDAEKTREQMRAEIRALSDSMAALRSEFGRSVERLNLEEAERLLVIANQRLQLSADTGLAGNALKLADDRLRRLSNTTLGPALGPVREIIADEIAALSDRRSVDVADTLNALSALARSVDALPLAGDVNAAVHAEANADDSSANRPADQSGGASWLWDAGKNFLADLGALVQVETDGKSPAPILSDELRRMIFEKTGLILESCQLAFLRAHRDVYAARMEAAKNWVTANFDTESAEVGAWLARWAALAAVSPEAELPDISGSLRALREVMGAGN